MDKIYQPEIIKLSEIYVAGLKDSDFFDEYDLRSTEYATHVFCDKLTEKFIEGQVDIFTEDAFDESEFEEVLKLIIAGTILYEMKDNGLINSYEDEDTEEIFFLTEKGKKFLNKKDDLT